jgi:hypothetical protein
MREVNVKMWRRSCFHLLPEKQLPGDKVTNLSGGKCVEESQTKEIKGTPDEGATCAKNVTCGWEYMGHR